MFTCVITIYDVLFFLDFTNSQCETLGFTGMKQEFHPPNLQKKKNIPFRWPEHSVNTFVSFACHSLQRFFFELRHALQKVIEGHGVHGWMGWMDGRQNEESFRAFFAPYLYIYILYFFLNVHMIYASRTPYYSKNIDLVRYDTK